jgi:glycosyltransferase 2 family protein
MAGMRRGSGEDSSRAHAREGEGEGEGEQAPPPRKRQPLRWALRLLGPALLAVVLLRLPDRAAILDALGAARVGPLALAVLLTFVNLQLKIVRWQVLLQTRGFRVPLGKAWAAFLGSSYIGMLTPGRVGDVLRVQYLRHDLRVEASEGLASVVMDRLCDLYVLVAFVAVGIARFSQVVVGQLASLAWATVALVALGPLLFLVPGIADRALGRVYARFSTSGDAGSSTRFLEALRANVGRSLALTIPLTLAAFGVNYVQGWLMVQALGLDVSFFDVTCLMAIASLLGLLPISISGVGVRELFFSLAFPLLGYAAASGVSFGLLVFVVIHLVMVAVGFISWQIAPPPTGPVVLTVTRPSSRPQDP